MVKNDNMILRLSAVLNAVAENNTQQFAVYVKQLVTHINGFYRENQFDALEHLIQVQYRFITHTAAIQKKRDELAYQAGVVMGTLELSKQILKHHYQQEEIVKLMQESANRNSIPHINEVLMVLCRMEMIQHGELAKAIRVDKSSLTPIMQKMEGAGLVSVTRSGRFKYYALSPAGKAYCRIVRPVISKDKTAQRWSDFNNDTFRAVSYTNNEKKYSYLETPYISIKGCENIKSFAYVNISNRADFQLEI